MSTGQEADDAFRQKGGRGQTRRRSGRNEQSSRSNAKRPAVLPESLCGSGPHSQLLFVRVRVASNSVIMAMIAVAMSRLGMDLGMLVLALLVMMSCFQVMVGSGMVMGSSSMMMLDGIVLNGFCHNRKSP